MQGVCLERWVGIRVLGRQWGFWRDCTGCYRAGSEAGISAKKELALTAVRVRPEQVDGVHYRWRIFDLSQGPIEGRAAA